MFGIEPVASWLVVGTADYSANEAVGLEYNFYFFIYLRVYGPDSFISFKFWWHYNIQR